MEEQIRVLQQDPSVKCIAKSHFTEFVKEALNSLVQMREAQRDERLQPRPIPDLKMTPAGVDGPPVSEVVRITPIYKRFRQFGRGPTTSGLAITMVIHHLQVMG